MNPMKLDRNPSEMHNGKDLVGNSTNPSMNTLLGNKLL